MKALVTALLLAVRLLAEPCDPGPEPDVRAPAYVTCCPGAWVTVKASWCVPAAWTVVRDQCGREHFHDTGTAYARYHCCGCCREWSVEGLTGDPCWCGWQAGDDNTVLLDPCPDISDEWEGPS